MLLAAAVLTFMGSCLCSFDFLDKQKPSMGSVILLLAGLIFMGFSFALMGTMIGASVCLLAAVLMGFTFSAIDHT